MQIPQIKEGVEHTITQVGDEVWADKLIVLPPYLEHHQGQRLAALADKLAKIFASDPRKLPLDIQANLLSNTRAFVQVLRRREDQRAEVIAALEQGIVTTENHQREQFAPMRARLRDGSLRGAELLGMLSQHYAAQRQWGDWTLDAADYALDLLLEAPQVSAKDPSRLDFMQLYQPTSVRALVEMATSLHLGSDDIVCDLGSGFSRVPALLSLTHGCKGIGVEFCEALHQEALLLVGRNNLIGVEPVQADVRDFDYSRANVFYMFNPFSGPILDHVFERLAARMEQGRNSGERVFVASLGDCTAEFAKRYQGALREHSDPERGVDSIRIFEWAP